MPHDFSLWRRSELFSSKQQDKIVDLKNKVWDATVAACPQAGFRPACTQAVPALASLFEVARLTSKCNRGMAPEPLAPDDKTRLTCIVCSRAKSSQKRAGPSAVIYFGHKNGLCPLWVKSRNRLMSALPPKAGISWHQTNVRKVPIADIAPTYSITSLAIARKFGGIERPSVFAVLRLRVSSNLVGRTIGRSEKFAPLRNRPA